MLENELQESLNDEKIINAMIANYEIKVQILDLVLNELKRDC